MSNAQAILILRTALENLMFIDDGDWDVHVNYFSDILNKFAAYEAEIPDEEKAPKLIRTLLNSFAPLALIQTVKCMDAKRLVTAVRSDIARRRNLKMRKLTKNIWSFRGRMREEKGPRFIHEGGSYTTEEQIRIRLLCLYL